MLAIKVVRNHHFSPLRYPGGKTSLTSFFDDIIKKYNLHDGTYVEPYAGGAGAALSLLLLEKVHKIIINDLDHAIYSFWKASIYDTSNFVKKIQSVEISINEWRKQKAIYKDKQSSEFDLGFATFFLNRTNRSGIIEGGPIGGMEQVGKWKIDARFNKTDLITRIERISYYRDRIKIYEKDGVKLLKYLKKTKQMFIYLDPPYYKKGSSLYLNHYIDSDHVRLAKFLNSNLNLNWLLTYDSANFIKDLYSEKRIKEFSLNYSAYQKMKGSEIMIFSDALLN